LAVPSSNPALAVAEAEERERLRRFEVR